MSSLQFIENASIQPFVDEKLATAGWALTRIGGTHPDTLHNPALDRYLSDGGSLEFCIAGPDFSEGDQDLIREIVETAVSNGKSLFNSPKVRVSSDPTAGKVLVLSPTDYFQGLATNEIAQKTVILTGGRCLDGTDLAFPKGAIPSLRSSKLSNHIGACALAFDVDGVVSLVKTGKASMIAAQKIAPSAAGSADSEDFHSGNNDLVDCVLTGLKRELVEEQGIEQKDITLARVIGFQRYLPRGGKPEFIGLIKIGDRWKNARKGIKVDEKQFTEGHIDLNCTELGMEGIRSWLKDNDQHLSFSAKQCFWSLFNLAKTDEALKALITD